MCYNYSKYMSKKIIIYVTFFLLLLIASFLVYYIINKDKPGGFWYCANGEWLQSGYPTDLKPETPCVKQEEVKTMNIFFSNPKRDPEMLDCSIVFPVERIVNENEATPERIMKLLLEGPRLEESEDGYISNINPKAGLKSFELSDGVARIDFTKEMNDGSAGSCKVTAIRSQIETTLKQFTQIAQVIISVEGNADEALQP